MDWDLGLGGAAYLAGMALAAAAIAQLWAWRALPHRAWIALTAIYFAVGALVSEWMFGWADEKDLQPNIDGLSRDEALLAMVLCVVATALLARRRAHHRPA